jgi:hypothetical protein
MYSVYVRFWPTPITYLTEDLLCVGAHILWKLSAVASADPGMASRHCVSIPVLLAHVSVLSVEINAVSSVVPGMASRHCCQACRDTPYFGFLDRNYGTVP